MSYHPPKEEPVGPLDVVALMGEYRVVDRGAGNRVLPPTFATRSAAWGWMTRQKLAFLNPGISPVQGRTTLADAWANLEALMRRDGVTGRIRSDPETRNDAGRFALILETDDGRTIEIDMPGCSLKRLQREDVGQPRMFIDGSSWYWRFANLKPDEDDR